MNSITRRIAALTTAAALSWAAAASGFAPSGTAQYLGASADGSSVYFRTSQALVPEDRDRTADLYARTGGQPVLLTPGDRPSSPDAVLAASTDGFVVFFSTPHALDPADTDDQVDVYARTAGGLRRITQGNGAVAETFAGASPSGDTAWIETGLALDPSDGDGAQDVYAIDVATGAVKLVSVGTAPKTAAFSGAGGSLVFFSTSESLSADDTDTATDVYFRDGNIIGLATFGSTNNSAIARGVAADGSRLIFESAEQLVAGDVDAYYDTYESGPAGLKLRSPSSNPAADAKSVNFKAMSADGTRVVFNTNERLSPGDTDSQTDLYAHVGASTILLSGTGTSFVQFHDASDSAQLVLLSTVDKLTATDTDSSVDLYRAGAAGGLQHVTEGNGAFAPGSAEIGADGTVIAFDTLEPVTIGDGDGLRDVYHRAGSIQLASVRSAFSDEGPAGDAQLEDVTGANATVFSTSERLTADDVNSSTDVYAFSAGALTRVSRDTSAPDTELSGLPAQAGEGASVTAAITSTELGRNDCRLDGGPWADCAGEATFGPLTAGQHTIEARATDLDGNVDPSPALVTVTVPEPQQQGAQPGAATAAGETAAGTTAAGTGATSDRTAPRLASLKATRRAARARVRFSVDEASAVRLQVQRKVGKRWRTVQSRRLTAIAGANTARLRLKVLAPALRIRLVASDAVGNRATPVATRLRAL